MDVYNVNLTGASTTQSGRTQETQRSDSSSRSMSTTWVSNGDRVELSGTLARISRAVSSFGADRSEKVAQLTRQYQSGNYQPDSVKTSQGMVAEALSAGMA